MQDDDAKLIRGFLRGDRAAIACIDQWIEQAGRPYRHRLSGEWDDVCQDLRMELMRLFRAERFAGESRLRTYLWRVVANTCLDRLRTRHRWAWTDVESVHEVLERDGLAVPNLDVQVGDRSVLRAVLERVSDECKRLWSMVLAGWRYDEMSDSLGITPGTLRVRVLRCRRKAVAIRNEIDSGGETESSSTDVTK